MKGYIKYVFSLMLAMLGFASSAFATGVADPDIGQGIEDVVATWDLVRDAMIPIGIFLLAWVFFKKLRKA